MALLRKTLLALVAVLTLPATADAALLVQAQGPPSLGGTGTADGFLSAGESFELTQTLLSSEAQLSSVYGRLRTSTADVSVTRSGSSFPNAAFGATTVNDLPFQISIGSSVACGTNLDFQLAVTADQGSVDLPLTVGTGLAGPLRRTDAQDVPRTIPDGSSIASSFEVTTTGLIKDVRVHIGRITHTYVGDLRIAIEAPDGTRVTLVDRRGGEGDDFVGTTFAATGTSITAASAPFTGTYRPEGDLSALVGRQQAGTWKLHVTDTQLSDTGTLGSWGGEIAQAVCSGNPIPSFTATPNPVAPGEAVTLDARGSLDPTPGGSITRYEWDLDGDGTFETDGGTVATTTASWPSKRSVSVGLRVTDNDTNKETVAREIHVTTAPTAAVSYLPAQPLTGQEVTFDASGSGDADGSVTGYAWDLDGNGSYETSTGSSATATRAFATPGAHVVAVRVTDDTGATDTERVEVAVGNRSPTARLSVPAAPVPGQQITLDASGSSDPDGTIVRYQWDLDGDGVHERDTDAGSRTAHVFPATGDFTVGVLVTDGQGATAATTATVAVNAAPLPALAIWPSPGVVGKPVYFGASGSIDVGGAIVRYEWDLDGDGSFETDTQLTPMAAHTYASAGSRTVRLRVTDDRGSSAVATATLQINAAGPVTGTTGETGGTTPPAPDGGTGGEALPGAGSAGPGVFTASLLGSPIQSIRLARRRGLDVRCQVTAAAGCAITAYLPGRAAVRLGLARPTRSKVRARVIGRATVVAGADGAAQVRVVLSRPARRALRRARKVRVVLRGSAVDASGQRMKLVRIVLLRR